MNKTLKSNVVVVRPFVDGDAGPLQQQANNPMVAKTLVRLPSPYTLSDAQWWMEACSTTDVVGHQFVIEVDGELAGVIGFEPMEGQPADVAEVGYWLGEAYWGRGIALNALKQVTHIAFSDCGVRQLVGRVLVRNTRSELVLEKAGFTRAGVVQNDLEQNGVAVDATRFHLMP